ncbi:MAG: calcium-binding protein [Paracoccaceae bacterium]
MVVSNVVVDGNIFSGQTFTGAQPGGSGFGAQFSDANVPRQLVALGGNGQNTSNVTFTNNQITGTAGGLNALGAEQGNSLVTIDAANSTITGNDFSGYTNRYGFQLRVRETNNSVTDNTFAAPSDGNVGYELSLTGGETPGTMSGNSATYGATDDTVYALSGNEVIDGGAGIDTINMALAGTGGSFVDLNSSIAFSTATGIDALSNFENATGSAGNDGLYGNAGDNVFTATGGTDVIDGRDGSDTFNAGAAATAVTANLDTGALSGAFNGTLTNIENIVTGAGADTVSGSDADNTISTGAGNDVIAASAGTDAINAGAGFDTVTFAGDRSAYTVTWDGVTATVDDGAGNVTTVTDAGLLDFATGGDVRLVSVTGDYTTIQAAVIASVDGDEVLVGAGTFAGANISENVTVRGVNAGMAGYDNLSLTGVARAAAGETVLTSGFRVFDATTAVIDGFRFENTNALNVNGFEANVTFSNNVIVGGSNQIITGPTGVGTILVTDNFISSVAGNGLQINSMGNGDVTVSGNLFDGTGTGAAAVNANGIADFTFSGNVVMHTDSHGVQVAGAMGDVTIDDNIFDSTVQSGALDRGAISVAAPQNFTGDLTITNNTVTDSPYGVAYRGGPDADSTVNTTTLSGNDFTGATSSAIAYIGSGAANILTGGAEASLFNGGAGADVITGGAGNDTIDGGAGADTAVFSGKFGDYIVDLAAGTVSGTDGNDIYSGLERLVFDDRTVFIVQAGESVLDAVAAADDGDLVYLAAGAHHLAGQLNVDHGIEIMGAGEGLTTVFAGTANWAIYVTADDVRISDLSVDAHTATRGIKVAGADEIDPASSVTGFDLENVTITGAGQAELDLNRVDDSTFTNVTLDGDGTAGNGVGISASNNLTFTNLTTMDNGWGGIGLFGDTSVAAWPDGINNITFAGTLTQTESIIGIYAEETGGAPVTNVTIAAFTQVYKVFNEDHRANGGDFTFFFGTEAEAVAFALALPNPGSSVITGPEDNMVDSTALSTIFIVADGMSIQAAIDAAGTGDTIQIREGTFTEALLIGTDLTFEGANAGISADGTRGAESIIDGSFRFTTGGTGSTIDGVSITGGTTAIGETFGVFVQADDVTLTNSILTGTDPNGSSRGLINAYGDAQGLTIINNSIVGWGTGLYLNPGADGGVTGNTFDGNGNHIINDGPDTTQIAGNVFVNAVGTQVVFGVINPGTTDLGAIVGANDFDTTTREVLVFAYGTAKTIIGTIHDDTFFDNDGAHTLSGGAGDDTLQIFAATDFAAGESFDGGIGNDRVVFAASAGGTLTLTAGITNVESVEIATGSLDAVAMGINAAAVGSKLSITGNGAVNALTGTAFADTIMGGAGDDTLNGGAGNDLLDGGAGADLIIGGPGTDTVTYANSAAGVSVNLATAAASGGDAQGDVLAAITNLIGSALDDVLIGDTAANVLTGGAGSDVLGGGAGNDTINGGAGNDNITGGSGNDRVFDGSGDDTVTLGTGDDYVRAGGGADAYYGGDGVDYISYYDSSNGVTLDLGANTATGSWAVNDIVNGFEGASGSGTGSDILLGTEGVNKLYGFGGDDQIDGRGGDDLIYGGAGNDTLTGGAGNDRVQDGAGDDIVYLGDGNDHVRVGGGVDAFYGGAGVDYISYYDSSNGVNLDLEANTASGSWAVNDIVDGFEGASGSNTGNDVLLGTAGVNRLYGFGGNDQLNGRAGNDFLDGGAGNDTLTGGSGADQFEFNSGEGNDRVTDFEDNIDTLRFDNFGYLTDAASALDYATQVGSDVLFDFGTDGSVLVMNVTMALLTNDIDII